MPTTRVKKLPRVTEDIRISAADMSIQEARLILREFIQLQSVQMAARSHRKNLKKLGATSAVMKFVVNNIEYLRNSQFKDLLDIFSDKYPEAKWSKSIKGVGPITAAGLVCYIDFDKAKNPSSLWKHAGLTPDSRRMTMETAYGLMEQSIELFGDKAEEEHIKWLCKQTGKDFDTFRKFCKKKGSPYHWSKIFTALRWPSYDLTLKHICLMLGNCFINHKSLYQDLFRYRRAWEEVKNEAGDYKSEAAKQLKKFNYKPWKDAHKIYTAGMLPPTHIVSRAKQWTVKIFLAHYYIYHQYLVTGKIDYNVYALDVLTGHRKILIPNMEKVEKVNGSSI